MEINSLVRVIQNSWSDLPMFAVGRITEINEQFIGVSFDGPDTEPYWFYPKDLVVVEGYPVTKLEFIVERTIYGDPAMENVF